LHVASFEFSSPIAQLFPFVLLHYLLMNDFAGVGIQMGFVLPGGVGRYTFTI